MHVKLRMIPFANKSEIIGAFLMDMQREVRGQLPISEAAKSFPITRVNLLLEKSGKGDRWSSFPPTSFILQSFVADENLDVKEKNGSGRTELHSGIILSILAALGK